MANNLQTVGDQFLGVVWFWYGTKSCPAHFGVAEFCTSVKNYKNLAAWFLVHQYICLAPTVGCDNKKY